MTVKFTMIGIAAFKIIMYFISSSAKFGGVLIFSLWFWMMNAYFEVVILCEIEALYVSFNDQILENSSNFNRGLKKSIHEIFHNRRNFSVQKL
jgi:hypothetical protein